VRVTIKDVCVIFVYALGLSNIWSLSYVALTLSKFGHPWYRERAWLLNHISYTVFKLALYISYYTQRCITDSRTASLNKHTKQLTLNSKCRGNATGQLVAVGPPASRPWTRSIRSRNATNTTRHFTLQSPANVVVLASSRCAQHNKDTSEWLLMQFQFRHLINGLHSGTHPSCTKRALR
jgi:hypothetical protein